MTNETTAIPDAAAILRPRSDLRNVLAMALPAVITTSSRAAMDVIDYVMVAQLPTHDAQAAILPAQVVMWSYIVFGLGVVTMVNTFAAQALGRGDRRETAAYAWQGIYVAAFFGLLATVVVAFVPGAVAWIGHEPGVQQNEIAYMRIALLTAGPTLIAEGLGWFFIGIHRPTIPMWTALEAIVVNFVVALVLIFGFFGFEPMGIAGAAWGTMAAVCYRSVRLGASFLAPSVHSVFGTRHAWRPSATRLIKLLRVGIPCGTQLTSEVVVWAIFVNLLIGRKFGTDHLIATNAAWQYMRVAFMPTIGVGRALSALVGKSIGERNHLRARRETRIAAVLTIAYIGVLSLVYTIWGEELIRLLTHNDGVARIGRGVMICTAVFQLFDAVSITYTSSLRGAGDTFVPSVFFIVSHWLIIIGGGWWIATTFPQLGSLGPWIAAALLIGMTAVFLWWRWHGGAWMRIALFGDRPQRHGDQAPVEEFMHL